MNSKKLLSEKIADSIIDLIIKGFFKPGDKMPNELQLAEELNISRATLREAIKSLESRNILEVRRGIGTFVAEVPGLSKDPLGIAFIDISANPSTLFSSVQFQVYQIFTRIKGISPLEIQRLSEQHYVTTEVGMPVQTCIGVVTRIAEQTALHLGDDFGYRLMRILNPLMLDFIELQHIVADEEYLEFYAKWVEAWTHKDSDALKAAFHNMIQWTLDKVI